MAGLGGASSHTMGKLSSIMIDSGGGGGASSHTMGKLSSIMIDSGGGGGRAHTPWVSFLVS